MTCARDEPGSSYPAPAGAPGEPFRDPNLKLVVLDELMRRGSIDLGSPRQLAEHVLGRRVDLEKDGYELLQPAYDDLACYPLTRAQLESVTALTFDGALDIYSDIHDFWDGEEDFDVTSLEGIGLLANLEAIDVVSMFTGDVAGELSVLASRLRVEAFLRSTAPDATASLSRGELASRVVESFALSWQLGLVSERALGRLAYLMVVTDDHLLDQAQVVDFVAHDGRDPDAQIETLMLAIASRLEEIALGETAAPLGETAAPLGGRLPDVGGDEGPGSGDAGQGS